MTPGIHGASLAHPRSYRDGPFRMRPSSARRPCPS
jgi:hypothetical protein